MSDALLNFASLLIMPVSVANANITSNRQLLTMLTETELSDVDWNKRMKRAVKNLCRIINKEIGGPSGAGGREGGAAISRNRVSNELRDEILYQIRDLAVPAATVAEDYGIKHVLIQKLLANPIITKQPSLAQKREIVHLFNSGQVSHTEIAERYNITTDNIAKWRAQVKKREKIDEVVEFVKTHGTIGWEQKCSDLAVEPRAVKPFIHRFLKVVIDS